MPVTVRHRVGSSALESLGAGFDDLARAADLPLTARRRWLQAWIDTHPQWEPWLISAEDEDDVVLGVVALARRRHRGVNEVVLIGHGPTDDARLPCLRPDARDQLVSAIVEGMPRGWWRLILSQVPPEDPIVRALEVAFGQTLLTSGQGMPIVQVVVRDPSYYLSKNSRKSLAKIHNKLKALRLEPQVRWTTDPDEVVALLPELLRVHRERDLDLGRRPDHADRSSAAFYREVITRHAKAGEIDLLTVHLDSDLAAYVCGFRDGRNFRSWDNRLAPRWSDVSAGRIANTEALRHVVTGDYDALDWMRGEEPYKLQSATEVVTTAVLTAWSSPALRHIDQFSAAGRERLRAFKNRVPLLATAVARTRAVRAR